MLFELSEKILEVAEAEILSLSFPGSWIERLFQQLFLKPWRYFWGGYSLIGRSSSRFLVFFILTTLVLIPAEHSMLENRLNYPKFVATEFFAALLLLFPLVFCVFASPKDYGLAIHAKLIEDISRQIRALLGPRREHLLPLLEKNIEEMRLVAQRRINVTKFSLAALWSGSIFFLSKDAQFPFDLLEKTGMGVAPVPGVIFLSTLLIGLSLFAIGLGLISEKIFLSIKLALHECFAGVDVPAMREKPRSKR